MKIKKLLLKIIKPKFAIPISMCMIFLAIWMQVPSMIHKYQIKKHENLIQELKWYENELKLKREKQEAIITWAKAIQHNIHDEANETRDVMQKMCENLCKLDEEYCKKNELCWEKEKKIVKVIEKKPLVRTYENIVIHHTATRTDLTLDEMERSMFRTHGSVPTHYIIWKDWQFKKTRPLWEAVTATRNQEYNRNGIHMEVMWNFNKHEPTKEQIQVIKYLISELYEDYGKIPIIWHNEVPWSPTACPWKLFPMEEIRGIKKIDWVTYLGEYNVSRYYSPFTNQSKYYPRTQKFDIDCNIIDWEFNTQTGSYRSDRCMNTQGSISHWAWGELTEDMVEKVVACPKEIQLGAKLLLVSNHKEFEVTCRDRGWAIKDKRLDLRMWFWESALDRILYDNSTAGVFEVYLLN